MKTRNESEERFYNILKEAQLKYDIKEPDADKNIIGTADFLVGDVVFEVKEIVPKEVETITIQGMLKAFRKNKPFTYFKPDIFKRFKTHLDDARKKFGKYNDCATCLVIDLHKWGALHPEIEDLISGIKGIDIYTSNEGDEIKRQERVINKLFRLDKFTQIGSIMFIFTDKILLYHNFMSVEHKFMSIDYVYAFSKLSSISVQQFFFINIPNGPCHIREIWG